MDKTQQLEGRIQKLEYIIFSFIKSDRYIFEKHIQMLDGRNFSLSTTTGTKIGTKITQKLGFYGQTPCTQPEAVTPAAGGSTVDSEARKAINDTITAVERLGLMA